MTQIVNLDYLSYSNGKLIICLDEKLREQENKGANICPLRVGNLNEDAYISDATSQKKITSICF